MNDHDLIEAIRGICEESFNPDKEISSLHRAQALAIIHCAILTRGANLMPAPASSALDNQITIEEALEELRR